MTPPTVHVNTYIQVGSRPKIDRVSKIYIICQMLFAIIRLPVLGYVHPILKMLLLIYPLGLAVYLISFVWTINKEFIVVIAMGSFMCEWLFLVAFDFISLKRLQRYYTELNVFDKEACCTPKIGKATIRNIVYTILMLLYVIFAYTMPYIFTSLCPLDVQYIPCIMCHILEVHFMGHLLSLLIPRLRLINYYMELSLSNAKITRTTCTEEFGFKSGDGNKALCKMDKLMNLYHTVIKSYSFLMEAIKWQLLVIITASFITVLCYGYYVSYSLIKDKSPMLQTVSGLALSFGTMLPLVAPCTLGDQVHDEVRRLRELLASRLYENQLDKASRGMARALLAWTETRDLSFTLLRMLNIDISLPFKFVGLLVTYLIILLQFQKVINPS